MLQACLPNIDPTVDIRVVRHPHYLKIAAQSPQNSAQEMSWPDSDFVDGHFVREIALPANAGQVDVCYLNDTLQVWLTPSDTPLPEDLKVSHM